MSCPAGVRFCQNPYNSRNLCHKQDRVEKLPFDLPGNRTPFISGKTLEWVGFIARCHITKGIMAHG